MSETLNDLSRSLSALEQDATLVAVVEMSRSSWLVAAGIIPPLVHVQATCCARGWRGGHR